METAFPLLIGFIYGGLIFVSAVILIYLIIKRIKEKGNEDFEQRDN